MLRVAFRRYRHHVRRDLVSERTASGEAPPQGFDKPGIASEAAARAAHGPPFPMRSMSARSETWARSAATVYIAAHIDWRCRRASTSTSCRAPPVRAAGSSAFLPGPMWRPGSGRAPGLSAAPASYPQPALLPTTKELDSCLLDSKLGGAHATDLLTENGALGS